MLGATDSLASSAGRRILAIRSGALGDTILALPALAALRRAAGPAGALTFAGREPFLSLAESPEHASFVCSMDRGLFRPLFERDASDSELRRFLSGFDWVVSWSRLPLLRERLPGAVQAIEATPLPPEGVHASEHLVRALAPLGIEAPALPPKVVLEERSHRLALEFLQREGLEPGTFVAIHPSSGSPRKNWPEERFAAFACRARGENWPILWIEGEADSRVVRSLAFSVPAAVARGLSLPVLGGVLCRSRVYLGNDSGVTHLAAAVGATTVSIFGPTDPRVWAPPGATVVDFGDPPDRVWAKTLESSTAR